MVLTVGDDVWRCCFQGPVHISKYGKVRLCHMKNNNKMGKKTKTKKE
jgi:hypothetical protein